MRAVQNIDRVHNAKVSLNKAKRRKKNVVRELDKNIKRASLHYKKTVMVWTKKISSKRKKLNKGN